MSLSALVLAVTLYALTRSEDPDLAMLAMTCRVVEGVLGATLIASSLALRTGDLSGLSDAPPTLGPVLARTVRWNTVAGEMFFAVSSTIISWLLLRGRHIPVTLAWLGVAASLLLVVLPLQLAGAVRGTAALAAWLPMAVFEVALGVRLIVRGVSASAA